ncbi:hypothetical protein [Streptomyces tsukubensis]|uniref:hypothetical protein n=1 Tax=Streptomyces tsukubensis TaxID=83656 RepID=UPI0034504E25
MRDDPRGTPGYGYGGTAAAAAPTAVAARAIAVRLRANGRRGARAALPVLAFGALLLLPAPAQAAVPAAPLAAPGPAPAAVPALPPGLAPANELANELAKYYVVKSPEENGGRVDDLAGIAGRTLGDPDRFQEILVLNTGRALPDGQLFLGAEQVVPGFALRLPADAEGQDVQFGALPGENGAPAGTGAPPGTGTAPAVTRSTSAANSANPFASIGDRVPLPLLVGGVAGVAALTAGIIARRALARALRAAGRGLRRTGRMLRPRLPRPLALALRRRRRAALARRLAADSRTPVVVRGALDELARGAAPPQVHTVRVENDGLLAAVSGADRAPLPWTEVTPYNWRRDGLPEALGRPKAGGDAVSGPALPHLARVGVDEHGAQIMVGLGGIRGALSVRGDLRVARDTVAALAHGLLELPWQNTVVVAVDPGADTLPGLHGLVRIRSLAEVRDRAPEAVFEAAAGLGLGLVRAPGGRGAVAGFLLVLRPLDGEEARALAELASPRGGWTALVAGDVPGAHWRWYAEPEGTVDLGVLGLRVTVPAPQPAAADRI